MAGMRDDMKDDMSDAGDMRNRFEMLKSKEMTGELDDKGREELEKLRSHFQNNE